ncbi:MAG TPA: type I-E CRISPR-associated protein Cas6/Cse3/CasE [Spirochaetales bacterium]|nr:type I-E CRISPR-associated protein Cas6/Cse3/CasE [Spirochaetales bacterium]
MIASVLRLSRSDCKALRVTDPYSIHRVVYSLFPKKEEKSRDFLFVDKGGDFNGRTILLLSEDTPETPEYGQLVSKEIPERFLQQDHYGFEVVVNPVVRDNKTGKIKPIREKDSLLGWFLQKAPGYGFSVDPGSLSVSETNVLRFTKDSKEVILGKAKFTGRLTVLDREVFIKTFTHGLGKGKGFGFGLLQIVPLQAASVDA